MNPLWRLLPFALVVLAAAGPATAAPRPPVRIEQLRVGMTPKQVRALLGPPPESPARSSTSVIWSNGFMTTLSPVALHSSADSARRHKSKVSIRPPGSKGADFEAQEGVVAPSFWGEQ